MSLRNALRADLVARRNQLSRTIWDYRAGKGSIESAREAQAERDAICLELQRRRMRDLRIRRGLRVNGEGQCLS